MRMLIRILALLAIVVSANSVATTAQDVARARQIEREVMAAREAGDNPRALVLAEVVYRLRPHQPGAKLRYAAALARSSQNEKSLALLEELAAQRLSFALVANADFAMLVDQPRFRRVVEQMAINARPLVASSVAFTLDEKDFLAEGIAFDTRTRDFFLASVYQSKIVRRSAGGEVIPFAPNTLGPSGTTATSAASGAAPDRWSIIALTIDSARRHLWATTAALEQTRGVNQNDLGRTAILQFDLDRETLLARYELPTREVKRVFGDLVLAENGDVIISESLEGGLYRVASGKLETFIAPGRFVSPQGMRFVGARLYVADYSLGLFRVDMQSRSVEWLTPPADANLLGLDGMVLIGESLIATQNGINPHRVVKIDLDASGHIARVTPLEVNHPRYNEPTLGVAVGSEFFYVANSQWELFEPGKLPPLEKLVAPVILRLPISVTSVK